MATTYKAGERPRIRVNAGGVWMEPVLTRINSRTAYFRARWIVGELACPAENIEYIRHPDGSLVLETEQWPPLTPYDTGERLEPKLWVDPVTGRAGTGGTRPAEEDDYGKVDFDFDDGTTGVTMWAAWVRGRLVVTVLGHSEIDSIIVVTQGEPEPTIQMES